METKRAHIFVHGMVQGVGFRFFVRKLAQRMVMNGWVRNCMDGSVEIMAEGEKGLLEDFIKEVRIGPAFSNVTQIKTEVMDTLSHFTGFEIRF